MKSKTGIQLILDNGDTVTVTARSVWVGERHPRHTPPPLTPDQIELADKAAMVLTGTVPGELYAEDTGQVINYRRSTVQPARKV